VKDNKEDRDNILAQLQSMESRLNSKIEQIQIVQSSEKVNQKVDK